MHKNNLSYSNRHLQNAYNQSLNYLQKTEEAILEFQEKVRSQGYRTFNVWKYLEGEFFKYYVSNHIEGRKPPKAITIMQWLKNDSITGAKLGTQDLYLICRFIDNHIPLTAYFDECIRQLIPVKNEVLEDLNGLNSVVLNMAKHYGNLAEEYDRSSTDKIIDSEEAARLIAFSNAIKIQAEKIISHLNLKKAS